MRIIIETDSAAAARRITCAALERHEEESTEREAGTALADATDGGQPPEELLSSLRLTQNPESSPDTATDAASHAPRRRGEDAGSAPAWLVGVIEGSRSQFQ